MKFFMMLISVLATIVVLLGGNLYWNHKTSVEHFNSTPADASTTAPAKTVSTPKEKEAKTNAAEPDAKLEDYTANWPKKARSEFKTALKQNKTYKIAIVGSQAMGSSSNGWGADLKKALKDAYGSHISVALYPYNLNSDEFIREEKHQEVADFAPDMVLFEPFILNDNGQVAMENEFDDIKTAVNAWGKAVILIQPSYPLYQATNYPDQVEQLKTFSKMEGYDYLDHWKNWPDPDSDAFKSYVVFSGEEQTAPSAKGEQVWYEYLRDYFIAD
ncbi:hypothetical protein [Heyndrickxia acidiproducens]|uniref:hypothetical protein n=1 Tax=Heyndrickxia acidiproducens TaxID=1121084 RepID=UPI00036B6E4A|nr:hypothetical protein [Heyndrickxia acidiproducens]